MTPLETAIDSAGGVLALATGIGVAPSMPSMWKKRGNVPAEHCPAIERLTRARNADDPTKPVVPCEALRPDVAWEVLRMQVAPAEQQQAA